MEMNIGTNIVPDVALLKAQALEWENKALEFYKRWESEKENSQTWESKYFCAETEKEAERKISLDWMARCHTADTEASMMAEAFRAVSGQDYEVGRDYSPPSVEDPWLKKFLAGYVVALPKHIADRLRIYFPLANTKHVTVTIPSVDTIKKGVRMLSLNPLRWWVTQKAVIPTCFALLLLNAVSIRDAAVSWWTAPTALNLGNWVRVVVCESCNHVVDSPPTSAVETLKALRTVCPSCGGEQFSERKARTLWSTDWEPSASLLGNTQHIRGYQFEDGTTTLIDSTEWVLPGKDALEEAGL